MMRSRRCLAPTQLGGVCQNYYDSCPVPAHRARSTAGDSGSEAAQAVAQDANIRAASAGSEPLADNAGLFMEIAGYASEHYRLDPELIVSDYWLIRTLHAWTCAVGDGYAHRRYPNPDRSDADDRVGRFVFSGGTSLSAAWGITQRWSEDIDLILSPTKRAAPRHLKQVCTHAFGRTALKLSGTHSVTDKGPEHCFASFVLGQQIISRIDVSFKSLDDAPIWTQREPVTSMIGRICDAEPTASPTTPTSKPAVSY